MNEDLRKKLETWGVDQEYIANFEREKIFKLSTLKLLNEGSLKRLFPEEGPRLEFSAELQEYRQSLDLNGNDIKTGDRNTLSLTPQQGAPVSVLSVVSPQVQVPQFLLQGDDFVEVSILNPADQQENQIPPTNPTQQKGQAELRSPAQQDPTGPVSHKVPEEQRTPRSSGLRRKDQVARPDDESFDLRESLLKCFYGRVILSYHEEHGDLTEHHRNSLADIIISDYLEDSSSKKLTYEAEKIMTAHVLKVFPKERKEIWLSTNPNKREKASGRGKLVVRYYHLRRIMLKNKMIKKPFEAAGSSSNNASEPDADMLEFDDDDEELKEAMIWLQNNKQPWSKVSELWGKTSKKRMHQLTHSDLQIHSYMVEYPALSEPSGYILIESDFETMYPNSSVKMYSAWPVLSEFIIQKLPKKVKEEIESSLTPDGKKIRTLRALPYLFPVLTAVKKGKKQWRPSRLECQEALVLHAATEGDLQPELSLRRKKYEEYGITLGPQAVFIGQDEDHVESAYVSINHVIYEVDNVFKAFDLTFKALHALDAVYSREILRECLFLQMAVYGIPLKRGEKGLDQKTALLVEEFRNFRAS